MQVREIESIGAFEALRAEWDAAFALDAHASPFMSWSWLRGWFEVTPTPWTILAAREDSRLPWTCFLPISVRGSRSMLRVDHLREVHAAGEPTADYTGFVCPADLERQLIPALGRHLAEHAGWDILRFEEVNDARLPMFLSGFDEGFDVHERQGTPCPRIELPSTWEAFMRTLSPATRNSLRKRMNRAERMFSITRLDRGASFGAIDRMIDPLTDLAVARTREHPDPNTWRLHAMLRWCARAGDVHMLMLWDGQTPVAGAAALIDRKAGSLGVYMTAFDERYSQHSPGRAALGIMIRDAIEKGYRVFDFLRGEEAYKLQFGAKSRHNRTLIIARPTLQATLRRGISGMRQSLRF